MKEDLRVIKTKQRIISTFLKLLDEKSFEEMTVKEITEQAQIGRKTFYLHYYDKYDLLNTLVKIELDELHAICEAKREVGLREGTIIWFTYFEERKEFFQRLFTLQSNEAYKKRLQIFIVNELRYKIKEKEITEKGMNHELFLSFFASGIIELIELFINNRHYDKQTMVQQVVKLMDFY